VWLQRGVRGRGPKIRANDRSQRPKKGYRRVIEVMKEKGEGVKSGIAALRGKNAEVTRNPWERRI